MKSRLNSSFEMRAHLYPTLPQTETNFSDELKGLHLNEVEKISNCV